MPTAHEHMEKVIEELFPDRPPIDKELAIRVGKMALDRGEPFFDAVMEAEIAINVWWDMDTTVRDALIASCRLTEIRGKL